MSETQVRSRPLPVVASPEEWRAARAALLAEEKAHMRAGDALAAKRRRLPMAPVEKRYVLHGPDGEATLLDLFLGKSQLIVYHFMFHPDWDAGCDGCSWFVDGVADVRHLAARDVAFALVSRAPLPKLEAYRRRMGWDLPWYSSHDTTFNWDLGATVGDSEHHKLSVFLRDGDEVYLAYRALEWTDQLEAVGRLLDVVPYGSQERGEDVPDGWPQGDPWAWMRRHDEYDTGVPAPSAQT